jgi:hypothetical protein
MNREHAVSKVTSYGVYHLGSDVQSMNYVQTDSGMHPDSFLMD